MILEVGYGPADEQMKRQVIQTAYRAWSTIPSWLLTLSCGHQTVFSSSAGDTQTKPPKDFDCAQCAVKRTNKPTDEQMKNKIQAAIGMIAIFNCETHVCVAVTDRKSVWFPATGKRKIWRDADAPGGYACDMSETEPREVSEFFTLDPSSHQPFKNWDVDRVANFLKANADAREELMKQPGEQKDNEVMAKKNKKAVVKKTKSDAPAGPERTKYNLFGFSIVPVIRKLKQAGKKTPDVIAIFTKLGVKFNENTVRSTSGNFQPETAAALTADQIKELCE